MIKIFENIRKFYFNDKLNFYIYILIGIAPIVFLSYEKIFGELYKLISLLCLIGIYTKKELPKFNWKNNKASLMIFIIYPMMILINQLLRWDWNLHEYLDRFRFFFAIPIFIYLTKKKFDFYKILEISLPLALIFSYITTRFFFIDHQNGDRFTDIFFNPIYYGEISLSLSLIIFSTFFINQNNKNLILNFLKIIGIVVGIVISVKSESRTGWENIIIVPMLLLWFKRNSINKVYILILLLLIPISAISLYKYNSIVSSRIDQVYLEVKNYPWSGGVAPETSVGQRITFYRISWILIQHEPWYGFGQRAFKDLLLTPKVLSISTINTINLVYNAHFHNELLTLIIWYGVWGVAIYFVLFILPLVKSLNIYSMTDDTVVKQNAMILFVFLVTQIVSGISDMTILFKYMIMYYSLIISCLLSSINQKNVTVNSQNL